MIKLPWKLVFSIKYYVLWVFVIAAVPLILAFVGGVYNSYPVSHAYAADDSLTGAQFVEDRNVTFAGKLAARSANLLDWVIANYAWVQPDASPFTTIWKSISTIVYFLLILFVLAAAFIIIVTRGQNITVRKFIPRFLIVVVLVVLSFAIVQFIYQITDGLQGLFLKRPDGQVITSKDLLNVAFSYEEFIGYKRVGVEFDEPAAISLLFVKLTAATYYVMFFILILRKIILWFFLIISPIFPLLLFFSPIRNTAKIWVGEFFRWLLYGPLFTIFLAGLVSIWQAGQGLVPLDTNKPCDPNSELKYPTAINILIGGPCQSLATNNTLNIPESFIQYIIALMMLWMVMIMPFILLKIFLDYLGSLPFGDTNLVKYLVNAYKPPIAPPPKPLPKPVFPIFSREPIAPKPLQTTTTGRAMELPRSTGLARDISRLKPALIGNTETLRSIREMLSRTNLRVPTLHDIAKLESASISKNILHLNEASKLQEALRRIAGTSTLMSDQEREEMLKIKQKILDQAQENNPVASSIIEASKKEDETTLPEDNKVQTVNLDDYEEVKKTWEENYRNLEPPNDESGKPRERKAWINEEIKTVVSAIDLLLASDAQSINKGKQMVSKILPFLLLGGFSKTEVISYLKAKLEGAKKVNSELTEEEGKEFVEVEAKKTEQPKVMTVERKTPGTS